MTQGYQEGWWTEGYLQDTVRGSSDLGDLVRVLRANRSADRNVRNQVNRQIAQENTVGRVQRQ
jgi:hypothetical protein